MPARTLFILAAVAAGYVIDSGVYLLLLLSSSGGGVAWWVTAVVLSNLVPPILFAPALGWLVDRLDGRQAWSAALVLSGLTVAGMGAVGTPGALVALACLQAILAVVVSASVFKLLPLAEGLDERRASSLVVGMGSVAVIVAPPVAAGAGGIVGTPRVLVAMGAVLLSCWALGSLVGAFVTGRKEFRLSVPASVIGSGLFISVAILVEGTVANPWVIAVAFVGGGLANSVHNVGVRNAVYDNVPAGNQGQAWSMIGAAFSAVAALGNVAGTPGLVGGARTVVVVAGAIGTVVAGLTFVRGTRKRTGFN